LAIQDADVGLFEKCFGASDNLFLMLAPVARLGAFYFREDGHLKCVHQFVLVSSLSSVATQGRTSSRHVNVDTSVGTHGVHADIARHSADQIDALVVASQRSDRSAPPEAPSEANWGIGIFAAYGLWMAAIRQWVIKLWGDSSGRSSSVKLRSWVLAALTLAVLTVSLLSYSFRHSVRPAAAQDHRAPNYIYLTVERDGAALRLLWDRNSSAVRGATRAVLHIEDGNQQSDRELAPSQLLAGQVTYQPQHSAVTFRLNVYAGEPNAIGLVQVMLPPSPVAVPPAQSMPPPPQKNWPMERPPVRAIAHAEAPAAPYALTARSNATRYQNIEAQIPVVASADVAKTSPPVAHETSPPTRAEESPWHSLNTTKKDTPPPGRELTVRASTTPVPGSRWGGLFGKIPLVRRLRKQTKTKTVDAVPVKQPRPIVRIPGDQQLIAPVAVGVKVYVNESGIVNDAEVVDYGDDPLSPTLANAALAAARNWTFAPPQVADLPVASQLIIHFYFSP
jgi:hypothetical protein